jgi:dTDP-4-amino-4,6-dideoxygalactose transaminase
MFFPPLPRFRAYTTATDYLLMASGFITRKWADGDDIALLERDFARSLDIDHAIAVNQARVGIYLAVRALVTPARTKVIMSPYTIFDVVNMVVAGGGHPVFADIERETCNIDASQFESLIDDQTAAVMVTHLHGLMCDIEKICGIAQARGVSVIEDTAQALGARRGERRAGTFGDIGVFSFGLAKNVNAFYGGMVVTRSNEINQRIRVEQATFRLIDRKHLAKRTVYGLATDLSTWPLTFRSLTYWVFRLGYLKDIEFLNKRVRVEDNPVLRREMPAVYRQRMSPVQARLIRRHLPEVDGDQQTRIETAALYHRGLSDIPDIILPPLRLDGSHAYLTFPIQVPGRHALVRHLMTVGRDCTIQHLKNCADLECFAPYARPCPSARLTASTTLVLPTYPRYARKEAEKMIAAIRSFFGTERCIDEGTDSAGRGARGMLQIC